MTTNNMIGQADRMALQQMLQVQPALTGISKARDALDLGDKELLHAGPPCTDKRGIATPVLNSAIAAILFEGWAQSPEEARDLFYSDDVVLTPAQSLQVAVPLADVLSPGMSLLHVTDMADANHIGYSPINGGDGPVTRVGIFNDDVVERLRWINGPVAEYLEKKLQDKTFELIPIARKAVLHGDDLHGRTMTASKLLLERIIDTADTDNVAQFLQGCGAFFLNVWMAASVCTLSVAKGIPGSSVVTAIGSNGVDFGVQIAALPGRWFTVAADAPLIPDADADTMQRALGAIGDSAVVDALGFGAMLLEQVPETFVRLQKVIAQYGHRLPMELLQTAHPMFDGLSRFRTGLTAMQVATLGEGPVISLGVLDRTGERGRLDGGFYFSAVEPFAKALQTIHP